MPRPISAVSAEKLLLGAENREHDLRRIRGDCIAYIWQDEQWPALHWDEQALGRLLARGSREQGRLLGKMEALGFDLRGEAHLRTLTEDVVETSEIESEKLPPDQVRSSIARRLGIDIAGLVRADRNVEGVVEMMLDATTHYAQPFTA